MTRLHLLLYALFTLFMLTPEMARAEVLEHTQDDPYKLELGGFARTRLAYTRSGEERAREQAPSASLVMGRLMGRASFEGLGRAEIELNVLATQPILDLFTELELGAHLGARLGLFKVPLSRELLLPITSLPIFERTWLSQRLGLRRRVGTLVHGHYTISNIELEVSTGIFNPQRQLVERFDQGMLWVSAVDLTWVPWQVDLHIAYMEHVLRPEPTLDEFGEPIPQIKDQQLDLAFYTERDHLRGLLEGLVSLAPDETGRDWALHGLLAYRFDPAHTTYSFEPAVSMDYLELDDGTHMRMTGNMHWLVRGRQLQASLGYSIESVAASRSSHTMLMELQGGF